MEKILTCLWHPFELQKIGPHDGPQTRFPGSGLPIEKALVDESETARARWHDMHVSEAGHGVLIGQRCPF
jgi:hypothetical protein